MWMRRQRVCHRRELRGSGRREVRQGAWLGDKSRPAGIHISSGVIVDNHNNLLVSDFYKDTILIYPPGHTSPSGKLTVPNPTSIALNKPENSVYVPECFNSECNDYGGVGVYDYPSGTFVATISMGGA